jgi:hypothetical protein
MALAAAALAAVGLGLTAATASAPGRRTAEAAAAPHPALDPRPAAAVEPTPQVSGETRPRSPRKAPKAASVVVDADLAKHTPGSIVRAVPVSKDQMILSYMPDWNFGGVDNVGIGNAGSRTLIDWPKIPDDEAEAPDRRFLVAIYSRKTFSNPPAGPLVACEILEDWNERTSWRTRPRYEPEPFAIYKFEPGEGWKLFDVTPLVRAQAKADRPGHGVLLRFLSDDIPEQFCSTYMMVSREGAKEWASRRPMLLVVKDEKSK